MEEKVSVKMQEGWAINYSQAYQEALGSGDLCDSEFFFEQGPYKLKLQVYKPMEDFEIIVGESFYYKTLVADRLPDNDPDLFHINLMKEGAAFFDFDGETRMINADSPTRVFFHNGLIPMQAGIPANTQMRSMAFKFRRTAFESLFPEGKNILNELFPDQAPMSYYTFLPEHLSKLLNEVFECQEMEFGRKAMSLSRGLEVFTELMSSIKKMVHKDELRGLHKDDYQRMMEIKEWLHQNLDKKIVVEDIADEFGMSLSKLKRDFKTLFNRSVYQYFTDIKMNEAMKRLQTGDYTVSQVAYDVGYENPSKFTQMFKKMKGFNPSEIL